MLKQIVKNLSTAFKKTQQDKKILSEVYSVLKECEDSEGFCLFISRLYKEDWDDKLRHHMFTVNFKDGDLPIAFREYKNLAEEHLRKNQLKNAQEKFPEAKSAPIEVVEPVEVKVVQNKPVEEFKVEEVEEVG
jgi:hypothetical protein